NPKGAFIGFCSQKQAVTSSRPWKRVLRRAMIASAAMRSSLTSAGELTKTVKFSILNGLLPRRRWSSFGKSQAIIALVKSAYTAFGKICVAMSRDERVESGSDD